MKKNQFILGILVSNQFGVLTRVSALFARRGFNIDSLSVGETENPEFSRITITTHGDEYLENQIIKQLIKLHDVKKIELMTNDDTIIRELLLLKVNVTNETRQSIMDAIEIFRSKVVDLSPKSICIEMTGEPSKLDAFMEYM
ncbi:MAG: ilvH, partial [Clostridia bacterium]|nr:ilvH [Clostridia bacterium]